MNKKLKNIIFIAIIILIILGIVFASIKQQEIKKLKYDRDSLKKELMIQIKSHKKDSLLIQIGILKDSIYYLKSNHGKNI